MKLKNIFCRVMKLMFPVAVILIIGMLLSIDEFDDYWGRLPDPGCLTFFDEATPDAESIRIDVWYGTNQVFGRLGQPQPWINILGTVKSKASLQSLSYSLNGENAQELNTGPDWRRLACKGDFNIEIDAAHLEEGHNRIVITAIDKAGVHFEQEVSIDWARGNVWPLPFEIDWPSVEQLTDVVQVVDGRWLLGDDGLRAGTGSYDRVVAIGDLTWGDYEIIVPFVIRRFEPTPFPSNGAGFGVILHWNGHNDDPIRCEQPRCGWVNSGGTGWYAWDEQGQPKGLSLSGYKSLISRDAEMVLDLKQWYYLKMRVASVPGQKETYSLKVWPVEWPEPDSWTLAGQQKDEHGPHSGSVLLVAHHVDITFGDIAIYPLP